jgi:hypothetical protein
VLRKKIESIHSKLNACILCAGDGGEFKDVNIQLASNDAEIKDVNIKLAAIY